MATQETTIQTLIVNNAVSFSHVASTTNPSANYTRLYIDNSGDIKQRDSSGTVSDVGGGSSVTRADLNLDTTDTVEFAKVGLGTSTVPHGSIGTALLALDGVSGTSAAPVAQFTTTADDYPIFQFLPYTHDNIALMFDCYFDATVTRASHSNSYKIHKLSDTLGIYYGAATAGNSVAMSSAITIDTDGDVGIGDTTPSYALDVNGTFRTTGDFNINADGSQLFNKMGIGTTTIPHGSIGIGRLVIDAATQPAIQCTTSSDNYPLLQFLGTSHDNVSISYDCYYSSSPAYSSDSGSNYNIIKISDQLRFRYDSGVTAGNTIILATALTFEASSLRMGINDITPSYTLDVNGTMRTVSTATFDSTATVSSKVGVGTTAVPHGGVGYAMLAIDGTDSSASGSHAQFTTDADNYPLIQFLNYSHNNINITFDAYWNSEWYSSDVGSNYLIRKISEKLEILYDSGISQGAIITWNSGILLTDDGKVGINDSTPSYTLDVNTDMRVVGDTIIANKTPASATATGTAGEIAIDSTYVYVCVATNTWKRAQGVTW